MMFHTRWTPPMRRDELLLEMTWEVKTTVLSMTPDNVASDMTTRWCLVFGVVLTDTLVFGSVWWVHPGTCWSADCDTVLMRTMTSCNARYDGKIAPWVVWFHTNGLVESLVLCDECALVLAEVQAATLLMRTMTSCVSGASASDGRKAVNWRFDVLFIFYGWANLQLTQCLSSRASLRRWSIRSLWMDAVLW